jgi:hypothetical protein
MHRGRERWKEEKKVKEEALQRWIKLFLSQGWREEEAHKT